MVLALLALMLQSPTIAWDASSLKPTIIQESAAGAPSTPVRRLRVLVSVLTPASSGSYTYDLADLADEVRDIWLPYADVDVVAARDADATGYDDRVWLVIGHRPKSDRSEDAMALGWIHFLGPGRPMNRITVSTAVVATLLEQARWRSHRVADWPPRLRQLFVRRTMGRAIAHELGHYLLRSSTHASSGLMRESLPTQEIMDRRPVSFSLRPADVALLERSAAVLARGPAPIEEIPQ